MLEGVFPIVHNPYLFAHVVLSVNVSADFAKCTHKKITNEWFILIYINIFFITKRWFYDIFLFFIELYFTNNTQINSQKMLLPQ